MPQVWLSPSAEAVMLAVAGWLLTYLLHSGVLLAAGLTLEGRAPGFRSPGARVLLLRVCLFGGILTATVQGATGVGPGIDVRVRESEELVARVSAAAAASPAGVSVSAAGAANGGPAAGRGRPALRYSPGDLSEVSFWSRELERGWPLFLVSTWAILALLLGARTLGGIVVLRRRLGDRSPVRSPSLRARFDELCGQLDLTRAPGLSSNSSLSAPTALPGGEVWLPESVIGTLDPAQQRAVLAHELMHVQARDPAFHLLARLLSAVLCLQPLNRIARQRLQRLSELQADQRVSDLGLGPDLAGAIIAVAERLTDHTPAPALLPDGQDQRSIADRIERLMSEGGSGIGRSQGDGGERVRFVTVGVTVALLLLVGPSVKPYKCLDLESAVQSPAETHLVEDWTGSPEVETVSSSARPPASNDAGPHGSLGGGAVTFAARDDGGLHISLQVPRGTATVRLRQGHEALRLILPGGRTQLVRPPGPRNPGEAYTRVDIRDGPSGDYVVYAPAHVRWVTVEVNGRTIAGRTGRGGSVEQLATAASPGSGTLR